MKAHTGSMISDLDSLVSTLMEKTPKRQLFCTCCANDAAKTLENLRGVRVDVFPIVLLCGAFRCEKCNLRTGLLYEVREVIQ